jgi:Tfp pilus assembly protein FimV
MFESALDTEHVFGQDAVMVRTHVRPHVRRRRTALCAAALVLVTVLLGPVGHAFQADAAPRRPRTVTVRPGDTLWSIARRTEPESDPRAVVDAIAVANGLRAGNLVPGQPLLVPVS